MSTIPSSRRRFQRSLLFCGIASSALYVVVDLLSAARYPGYSMIDQVVSEFSAIGAPTARYWSVMGPAYELLLIAFAIGVLREAERNRVLRSTGWLLLGFGLLGNLWAFFPMHQRGEEMTWTDIGHIALGVVTVLYYLTFVAVGTFALGRRFRLFSVAMFLVLFASAVVTFSWAPRLAAGKPTPLLGLAERITLYGYLVWVAMLAIALLQRHSSRRGARIRSPSSMEQIVPEYRPHSFGELVMPGVIDPVCGMTIESENAAARTQFDGRTFFFCSESCKREFDADPARYAATTADQPESLERHEPPFTKKGGFVAPKFGSAGSGGAEYERLPEAHDRDDPSR